MFGFFKKKSNTSVDFDQSVIDQLVKAGSDFKREHVIEYAFYGEWDRMNKIGATLVPQGYAEDRKQSDKMLVMTKPLKLTLISIKEEILKMEKLAREYGVEFDGWSTAVNR